MHHNRFAYFALDHPVAKGVFETQSPAAQGPGSGERGTHSTMEARLRTPWVPDNSPPREDAGSEAWHFVVMRWDFSHQAMAKRAAKKGGREPSSPFSIMNQAGLDGARIPTFDILLSFKIQKKKIYWLQSYTPTIHQSLCLKSSGEAAGLKWFHSDGLRPLVLTAKACSLPAKCWLTLTQNLSSS